MWRKKKTTEEFIEEARLVHGDKYDYSRVEYKSAHEKVNIICPIHGEFWQTATNHLRGQECYKCGLEKRNKKILKQQRNLSKTLSKFTVINTITQK